MPLRVNLNPRRLLSTSNPLKMVSQSPFAPKSDEELTLKSTITLQDGKFMPRFGIGAWAMRGSEAHESLLHALTKVGYRHIDTAKYYRNEKETGSAIIQSKIPRNEIWATTKLFTGSMGGGSTTEKAFEDSLQQSGLHYWDLVLLHAPDGGKDFRLKTWDTLTKYVESGQIKSLGVSNFGKHHIDELIQYNPKVKPVVNQIECHPFFAQTELRKHCEKNGIVVQAYCPLARGRYYDDKTLKEVAQRNNKSEAQVLLRWLLQHGMVPLPKSSNPERQKENAESLNFQLSVEDMKALDSLDRGQRGSVESQTLSQNAP